MGNNPSAEGGIPSESLQSRFAPFTQELAEKLKLTKAKSESATEELKRDKPHKSLGAGATKLGVGVPLRNAHSSNIQSAHASQSAIQGIKIENDPLEREIYVKCPGCMRKVFDSGLENELECDFCGLSFVSGKEYTPHQLQQMKEQSLQRLEERDDEEDDEEGERGEDDEGDEEDSEDSSGGHVNHQERQKVESELAPDKFKKETPGQHQLIEEKKRSSFKQSHIIGGSTKDEELKSTPKKQHLNLKHSSSEKVSDHSGAAAEISPGKHPQIKKQQSQTEGVTPGRQPRRSSFSAMNHSPAAMLDSSSQYVNELEEVVLFCNMDTMMADFLEPDTKRAKLQLIQQALLMPFFQLRTRILERASYFRIGQIEFYVAACEPYDFGKVASKTTIRCTQAVSKSDVLQRVNLVPLRRLDNSRTAIFETAIKPFLEEHAQEGVYVHKNQVLEFEDYEFYVKYARPFFGRVDLTSTDIKIDSATPKPVQVLRIAPIWEKEQSYERAVTHKQETFDYIKKTYLHPYFYCGFMCYVERGETLKIDDQEFFLNDCRPKAGIIDKQTIIELEVGFTQEVFKKKQVLADQRFAEKIQTRDSQLQPLSAASIRQRVASTSSSSSSNPVSVRQEDFQEFLRIAGATGDMMELFDVPQLPVQIDQQQQQDQANSASTNQSSEARASATQYNVDEYHLLLLLQQQAQLQQRYLQHNQGSGRSGNQPQVVPKVIVESLPEHTITQEFLSLRQCEESETDHGEGDSSKKCMVCIMDYEVEDVVRTMPCLHYFHTECIDKWLLTRATTCPICKFDVRRNYNAL